MNLRAKVSLQEALDATKVGLSNYFSSVSMIIIPSPCFDYIKAELVKLWMRSPLESTPKPTEEKL